MSPRRSLHLKISNALSHLFSQLWNRLNKEIDTLVELPVLLNVIEAVEVVELVEFHGTFIVQRAFPLELVVYPVSFVSFAVILVVESAKALHFIVFPLAIVAATILIVKLTLSMSLAIQFVSFISTA